MLPRGMTCKACGKVLNATGGRPAELYLGTFTGLCYECERKPFFVERVDALDGARWVSYPPSCPSNRRDRVSHIGYADCTICDGNGVSQTTYQNWSWYYESCSACRTRYYGHPVRVKRQARHEQLYTAANAVWKGEVERIARTLLPKKAKKKAVKAAMESLYCHPRMAAIRREIFERYKRASGRLVAIENAALAAAVAA